MNKTKKQNRNACYEMDALYDDDAYHYTNKHKSIPQSMDCEFHKSSRNFRNKVKKNHINGYDRVLACCYYPVRVFD